MAARSFYLPFQAAVKPTNVGAPGAKYYFYVAGSTTLQAIYSNSAMTTRLANPVIADGAGRIPAVYMSDALTWKLYITDKSGTALYTRDPYIPGVAPDAADLEPYQTAAESAAAEASASAASAAAALLALLSGSVATGVAVPRLSPETYAAAKPSGVCGDGTDDGLAFAAMSAALNAIGGGAIDLYPGRTYYIGSQTLNGTAPPQAGGGVYTFAPNTPNPIEISGCTRPVVINGNGAKIKCLSGKKYGSFNENGTARADTAPFYGAVGIAGFNVATPYAAMVYVHDCTGPVAVHDLELDGNIAAQTIGGVWGDTDRQLMMTGLMLEDNTGPIYVRNVNSHHHGLDGGEGDGPGDRDTRENVLIESSVFKNNGRQGFSLVGGNGWHFLNCAFNETGTDLGGTMTYSAPGAGFDMEAEGGKWVTNTLFTNCRFEDSIKVGFVSDTNATISDNTFRKCIFVGANHWSVWPYNPRFVFEDCTIVGAMTRFYASSNPALATKFRRCLITDDVALSSTGAVYGGGSGVLLLDVGGGSQNILFDECHLKGTRATGSSVNGNLPTSPDDSTGIRLHNCTIERTGVGNFGVGGIYSGERTTLIGGVDYLPSTTAEATAIFKNLAGPSLDSFIYDGTRYKATWEKASGKQVYYGSTTYDPPSLALAAKGTIQTMTVTGVALGDKVEDVSFSINLAGARIHAWVSAANTVSYYFINENGANPLDLASGTLLVKVRAA